VSAFDLTATMDGLAALAVSANLAKNVYAYPVESVTVPCIVVGYPSTIDLDATMARGSDHVEIPVWYVVGKTGTKDARDGLSLILADASSVKSVFDGNQSFGAVRVTDVEIAEITIAAVVHLGAKFSLSIYT
jgi:hypothetical protein